MLIASLSVVSIVPFAFTGTTRTAAFVVAFPLAMMFLAGWTQARSSVGTSHRPGLLYFCAMCVSNVIYLLLLHALRWYWNPDAFFGQIPQDLWLQFYSVVFGVTLLSSGFGCIAFSRTGFLRPWRWYLITIVAGFIVGLGLITQNASVGFSPAGMLSTIRYYEQRAELGSYENQELSSLLAACGRHSEAEAIPDQQISDGQGVSPARSLNLDDYSPQPWQQVVAEVAAREKLVIIMEAHNAPKHRQWIEQVLPVLHQAGFQDYAAETLQRPTRALRMRGYPTNTSGYYSRDPSFGNVLRTALELGFRIHAYESKSTESAEREYEQAKNIAEQMSKDPSRKFIVHAGYGHVYKTPDESGAKLMACHLWEMTGIEPYCIYQTWHSPQQSEALQLSDLIGDDNAPVMLVPPPNDMLGWQLRFPESAVDALVVHSPFNGGPAEREHCFEMKRNRISGKWLGDEWPVVIGAFKLNESEAAVALDQLMLRENEREFVLWVPDVPHELRIFDATGQLSGDDVLRIDE